MRRAAQLRHEAERSQSRGRNRTGSLRVATPPPHVQLSRRAAGQNTPAGISIHLVPQASFRRSYELSLSRDLWMYLSWVFTTSARTLFTYQLPVTIPGAGTPFTSGRLVCLRAFQGRWSPRGESPLCPASQGQGWRTVMSMNRLAKFPRALHAATARFQLSKATGDRYGLTVWRCVTPAPCQSRYSVLIRPNDSRSLRSQSGQTTGDRSHSLAVMVAFSFVTRWPPGRCMWISSASCQRTHNPSPVSALFLVLPIATPHRSSMREPTPRNRTSPVRVTAG